MSRLPIRVRLTLVFAVVMAVMLTLLGAFLYLRLQDSLDERIADDLENRSATLVQAVRAGDAIDAVDLRLLRGDEGIGYVVGTGQFSGDSVLTDEETEIARAVQLWIDRGGFRILAAPVDGSAVAVVGASLEDRDEALDALLAQLAIALPLALLVASLVGYFVAGAALRPVEAMRRGAAEISSETPGRRLPLLRADDEISRLGVTLNEMLDRLDEGLARERRLVADASHELRTPLAALRTELELAARHTRTQAELEAALVSAGEEVERLVRLAEDLLVLARADEGRLPVRYEEVRPSAVLEAVASRNQRRATDAGRSLVSSSPEHVVLAADRARVEQALDALVDNAIRHGGGQVRLSAREENGGVVFAVSDEGTGFPPDFLPRAFERFSRADTARSGAGTGLGLAIVDAIARAHGGETGAANRPGGGVDVWLVLPDRLNAGDAAGGDSSDVV